MPFLCAALGMSTDASIAAQSFIKTLCQRSAVHALKTSSQLESNHITPSNKALPPTGMRAVIQSAEAILSTPSTETLTSQYGILAEMTWMRGILCKFRNLIKEENSVEIAA